jgi:hypothetical protein
VHAPVPDNGGVALLTCIGLVGVGLAGLANRRKVARV